MKTFVLNITTIYKIYYLLNLKIYEWPFFFLIKKEQKISRLTDNLETITLIFAI